MPLIKKVGMKPAPAKAVGVLERLAPMNLPEDEGLKMTLYGRSGTGKTTLWATFPKPIMALICSGGMRPGELRSINTPEYRDVIYPVTINHSEEVFELAEHQQKTNRFKTVVLDHASGLQDLALTEILGLKEIMVQKSWGMATQQQYGQVAVKVKEYLRALLNLSCNLVIVAQERNFNENGGEAEFLLPSIGAALMPSITGWLNPASDYVCQTFIRQKEERNVQKVGKTEIVTVTKIKGKVEYCLRTAPDPIYMTKFRDPTRGKNTPPEIVDPTYDKIKALVDGMSV